MITNPSEEHKFASKFFQNVFLDDNIFYGYGEVLPKALGWIVVARRYFNMSTIQHQPYKNLFVKTKSENRFVFHQHLPLNEEWKKDPMKLFHYYWIENQ